MCVYSKLDEISVSSIRHRVLREFKIPLTTPRRPDTRYKSHVVEAARGHTHSLSRARERFHSHRLDVELISPPHSSGSPTRVCSINESWQTVLGEEGVMKYCQRMWRGGFTCAGGKNEGKPERTEPKVGGISTIAGES